MRAGRTMVVGLALIALAGCGGADDAGGDVGADAGTDTTVEETTEPAEEPSEEPMEEPTEGDDGAAAGAVSVEVAETDLGEVLVDAEGMTLYMFDPDAQGESTCYDDCATNWPPLVSEGEATVGEGLDEAMLGSVERTDGSMQVTYNDWPLYYWAKDAAAGDVTGQAVGDVWWVVGADGEPIRTAPAS
jgi:predicted lipoprotein with Yx(FWY)xxD motif